AARTGARTTYRTGSACQRSPEAATMRSRRLGASRRAECRRPSGVHRLEGSVLVRVIRAIVGAIRGHPRVFLAVAATVIALSILGPPAVLSIARRPVDYFTV